MNYDFLILSPFEFELLTRDLLQKELDLSLESFGSGKDDGIDLRYSCSKDIIVQCKRYKNFDSLYQNLKKEVPKVRTLNPDKYIISTSSSLSPKHKSKIIDLFHPFINSPGNIYGKEDLNNLISKYQDIERNHYKLWLASTNVLQEILNRQVLNQSRFVKDEIFEKIGVYVHNESFSEAMAILKKNKYVIISGNPGIGKTTLAEMVIYQLLAQGIEQFIYLSDTINRAYELYTEDKSQIFLFDDFLGRNFLENKLPTNEERQIIRFIERVEKGEEKFLVFTTREYILNQATEKFEEFKLKDFSKCILDLGKYSKLVKAEILYNHFHINNIPYKYVHSLIKDDRVFEVINHANYNPRIIESFTKAKLWNVCKPDEFPKLVLEQFNNPHLVWRHAYETQISDIGRAILMNLIITGNQVELHILYSQLKLYVAINKDAVDFTVSHLSFRSSLRELENSFIKIIKRYDNVLFISFQNPSIYDFLVEYLSNSEIARKPILNSIQYVKNALSAITLEISSKILSKRIKLTKEEIKSLEKYIIDNFDELNYQSEFNRYSKPSKIDDHILKLYVCFSKFDNFDNKFILSKINDFITSDLITWQSINEFTELLDSFSEEIQVNPVELFKNLSGAFINFDDLTSLETLKGLYPNEFEAFKEKYYDEYSDIFYYIIDGITSEERVEESDFEQGLLKLEEIEDKFDYDTYDEVRIIEEELQTLKDKRFKKEVQEKSDEDFFQYMYHLNHPNKEIKRNSNPKEINPSNSSNEPMVSEDRRILDIFESLK